MKKLTIIIILLATAFLFSGEQRQKTADFELLDSEGNSVKLSEVNDKLVLIDFWATWCTPCKKALPHLSRFQQEYEGDLTILAINIDKPRHKEKAKAYIQTNDYKFTNHFDPEQATMKMFNVVNPPRTILVAPGMEIVYTHDGYKRGDEDEIEEQIKHWIDYKPAETKQAAAGNVFINGINEMIVVPQMKALSQTSYSMTGQKGLLNSMEIICLSVQVIMKQCLAAEWLFMPIITQI